MLAVVLMSTVSFGQLVSEQSFTQVATKNNNPQQSIKADQQVNRSVNAVVWSSDFSDASEWTTTHADGADAHDWIIGTTGPAGSFPSDPIASTTADNGYALFDSDLLCGTNQEAYLTTATSIDLSANLQVILSFESSYRNWISETYVSISTDNTVWTDIQVHADVIQNASSDNPELVELDITEHAAGEATVWIRFKFIGGCDYAWMVDDVAIDGGATNPDLVAVATGFVSEYYAQPMDQAIEFAPTGTLMNEGLELVDATDYVLTIGDAYTSTQAITVPFGIAASEDFTFDNFTPEAGAFTFTYTAALESDEYPANNTVSTDITFGGAELIRDNGVAAGNIGIGTAGGEMGNVFTITAVDTVTSVKWVMAGTAGAEVSIVIRNFTTVPTDEVGMTFPVINDGSAEYEAEMLGLVILQPGTYFIGVVEGSSNVGVEYTTTPYTDGTAWAYFNDQWNDLGAMDFKHTYHIRPQFNIFVPTTDDAALLSINNAPTVAVGNVDVTGTVRNNANSAELTSFDVVYSIDGTESAVFNVTGVAIASGASYDFTHDVPYNAVVGSHVLEVTITNPNGVVDENDENNTLSMDLLVLNELFPKTVVYEEGTGTWCGWCVRGLVGLSTMHHNITDGSWIGIAVHNGDPMVVTEYDAAIGTFISGYPSGVMNRFPIDVDPGLASLEAYYGAHVQIAPVAKVDIQTGSWDGATREMNINLESTFALDLTDANYNAAVIVVENGVTGTAADWAQANYYSGGSPMTDWDGTDYTLLADPIPAADMVYNHVGRALVGGWAGAAGSIPASVTYNSPNAHTFTHFLAPGQDYTNIHLVGIVIDNSDGTIVNAVEVKADEVLTDYTGITKTENSNFQIYPNPSTGLVNLVGVEGAQVVVCNMVGEVVYTESNAAAKTTVDLSNLASGNYIVKIINNDEVSTQKIVLTK